MSAVTFVPGNFYKKVAYFRQFHPRDVSTNKAVTLQPEEIVLCEEIVTRTGDAGRGLYAQLRCTQGKHRFSVYLRVSKNHIGSGDWEELNEMVTLALLDELPLD